MKPRVVFKISKTGISLDVLIKEKRERTHKKNHNKWERRNNNWYHRDTKKIH